MSNLKQISHFYESRSAEILFDDILAYKIIYWKRKWVLVDLDEVLIAQIQLDFTPFFIKNVVKVKYLKDVQTVTVDKNLWGSEYLIKLTEHKALKIKVSHRSEFEISKQKILITRIGGCFEKFSHRLQFNYPAEEIKEIEMIVITFFYILRCIKDP